MNTLSMHFIYYFLLYYHSVLFKNETIIVTSSELSKERSHRKRYPHNTFPCLRTTKCVNNLFEKNKEYVDDLHQDSSKLEYNTQKDTYSKSNPNFSDVDYMCDVQILGEKFAMNSIDHSIGKNFIDSLNIDTFHLMYILYRFVKSSVFENINLIVKKITMLNLFNFIKHADHLEEQDVNSSLKLIPLNMRKLKKNEFDRIYHDLISLRRQANIEVLLFNNNSFYLKETINYMFDIFNFTKEYVTEIQSLSANDNFLNMCCDLIELTFKNLKNIFSKDIKHSILLNRKYSFYINKEITKINDLIREELKILDSALKELHSYNSISRVNFDLFFNYYIINTLKKLKEKSSTICTYVKLRKLYAPFVHINTLLLQHYKQKLQYQEKINFSQNKTILKKYLRGQLHPHEKKLIDSSFKSYKKIISLKKRLSYLVEIAKLNFKNKKLLSEVHSIGIENLDNSSVKEKINNNLKVIDDKLKIFKGKKRMANMFLCNINHGHLLIEALKKNESFLKNVEKHLDSLIFNSIHIKDNFRSTREQNLFRRLFKRERDVILDDNFISAYAIFYAYLNISFSITMQ